MSPRSIRAMAIATQILLVAGCGPRAARPNAADERNAPVAEDRATGSADAAATTTVSPPSDAEPPPPRESLPWVNPSRCLKTCTYDPGASLVRVDKQGALDPAGSHLVERTIQEPLRALVTAAHAAGHKIRIESAYRSYDDQMRVFRQTKQIGRAARPGHSEHQLGTAIDFRMPTTAAIDWLAEHAPEYGFVLSYPDGKQRITGYRPEPWHVRFVGQQLANELRGSGMILEELFRTRADLGESGSCDDCPQPASRSACGKIDAAGTCDGNVLQWCYDDALASVDCGAFKQRCGRARGADVYDCLVK
ncbi:MAG: M15 family metallopeptidase [Kofleriaceae bacterium]|nr:M15 family metallopeptidase [Kofleriaceae bacterium]